MSMINGRKFRVSPKSGNQIAQGRVSIVWGILKDASGKYLELRAEIIFQPRNIQVQVSQVTYCGINNAMYIFRGNGSITI